jgi:hypothetical protein
MTARAEFKDAEAKAEAIIAARAGGPLNQDQLVKLNEIYQRADDACRRMLDALQDMIAPQQQRAG